jgi:Mitochondrial carrier protein
MTGAAADASQEPDSLVLTCAASASAGIIARLCCHSLDTVKARLQGPHGDSYRGISHAFKATLAEEGVRGLYRGLGAVIVGGTPGTCIYLTTYELAKRSLEAVPAVQQAPAVGHLAAGMLAETVWYVV